MYNNEGLLNPKDIEDQFDNLNTHTFKDRELMSLSSFCKYPNGIIISVESRELNADGRIISDDYDKYLHFQHRGLLTTCCGHLKTFQNDRIIWEWKQMVSALEPQYSSNQELIRCIYAEIVRNKLNNTQIMFLDTIAKKLTIIERENKGLYEIDLDDIRDPYMRTIGSELIDPFCFYELSKENHSFNTTEGALLFLNNYYTLTIETANYFVRELNLKRNSPYGGKVHHFLFDKNYAFLKKIYK